MDGERREHASQDHAGRDTTEEASHNTAMVRTYECTKCTSQNETFESDVDNTGPLDE
jgi:hypothetical protein